MLDPTQLTGKQRQFLQSLQGAQTIDSLRSHCKAHNLDFNFAKGFLLSGILDGYVQWWELSKEQWRLADKGLALNGRIPGVTLAEKLRRGVHEVETLKTLLGASFSVNFGALRREKGVDMRSDPAFAQAQQAPTIVKVLRPEVLKAYQERQDLFEAIASGQPVTGEPVHLAWLQQQGYITTKQTLDYRLTPLTTLQNLTLDPVVTSLTSDLLLSGRWQQIDLKPYNIHDAVPDVPYGRPTLLSQCIQQIRDIFLNMGFDEMSGGILESAFWNFDALFTPQDHPAREVQDTFYLTNPQTLPLPDDALVQRVKTVHEQSYGTPWTEAEASRAILRAHTTPTTARTLYALQGEHGKYFSIGRVFRNESVDRTHLAEFHQIEGVVIGELLTVRTLMGYLTYFYERLGFQQLKFKPTYNPYTEPSLEVFAYHRPSDRYLEVGNSGLFRPEVLGPLGYEGKTSIAWGLGLERIAMLIYDVEKLSDLIGPDIRLTRPPSDRSGG